MNFLLSLVIFNYLAIMKNTPVVGLCDFCLHKGITTWLDVNNNDNQEDIYYYFCKKVQRDPGQFMELAQANRDDYFGYYGDAKKFRTAIVNCSEFKAVAAIDLTFFDYDPVTATVYISWFIERGYSLEQLDIYQDGVLLPIYTMPAVPDGAGSAALSLVMPTGSPTIIAELSGGSKSLRMSIENVASIFITDVRLIGSIGNIRDIYVDYTIAGTNNLDTVNFYIDGVLITSGGGPGQGENGDNSVGNFVTLLAGTHQYQLELVALGIFSKEFFFDIP